MPDGILKFNDTMFEKWDAIYQESNSKLSILEYVLEFHLDDYVKDIQRYFNLLQALQR